MEIYGAKIGKLKRRILIVCNSGLWMLLSKFARVATSEDPALSLVETEVDPFESCQSYSVEVDEHVCLSLNDELECNAPTGHLERERERERNTGMTWLGNIGKSWQIGIQMSRNIFKLQISF